MNIKQALIWASDKLSNAKINSAHLDAEIILSFIINKTREYLFTYPEKKLTTAQLKRFQKLINKRAAHLPVAYITNNKEFYNLDFFVNENVLIPRPETEILVESALSAMTHYRDAKFCVSTMTTIADIGTGSGCIAISIAKNNPNAHIIATDISRSALTVAKRNAKRHGVAKRIKFYQGDLIAPIRDKRIDVIVANLPYLSSKTSKTSKTSGENSLRYEPKGALYAEKDGLRLYEKLFKQICKLKYQPKLILTEIDPRQTTAIKKIIKNKLLGSKIEIIMDLAKKNRVVKINLK